MKTQEIIRLLESALDKTHMRNASFRDITSQEKDPTDFIRERTRIFRASWIADPIIEALELLDGKQRINTVYEKQNSAPVPLPSEASADSAAGAVNTGGATSEQVLENGRYKVTIRADRMSGWFERDGEAIGGLTFGTLPARDPGAIELTDYDGVFELPNTVALLLRDAGVHVDSTFL